jgi:hypothetical protein
MLSVFTMTPTHLFSITLFHPKDQDQVVSEDAVEGDSMGPRGVCRLDGIEAAYCMLVDVLGRPINDLKWKEGWLSTKAPRDRKDRFAERESG